jgi:hypothetical protein
MSPTGSDRFLLSCKPSGALEILIMPGAWIRPLSQVLLCGVVAAFLAACGTEAESDQAPEIAACTVARARRPFRNQEFVAQTQRFIAEFTATPSVSPTDAVVGFSDGPARRFSQLAASVRFNPNGTIDVRAGSTFQADVSFPYTAGTTYRFRLEIDVGGHSYSVSVGEQSGVLISLARSYPFRTEQAQAGELSHVAAKVDARSGVLEVCDLHVTAINAAGCPIAQAGTGFLHQSIGQPAEVVASWDLIATPDSLLYGVIGLSQNPAARFADLAAAVRFAPNGLIEARNGSRYQADVVVPYRAGEPREIRIIAEVPLQTYSVYVAGGGATPVQLARGYAFRSPGTMTRWISELAAIVDSTGGELTVCDQFHGASVGVRFLREGNFTIAPLPNEESLISDGTTTLHLSSTGQVLAHLDSGGHPAVDMAGNVYLARIDGTELVVEAYTADLVHRWTRSYPAGEGKRILAVGSDSTSVVAASGPLTGGVDLVKRWLADGTESTTHAGPLGDAIAIGSTGFVLGSAVNGTVVVTKWPFGPAQRPQWQRVWNNGARIAAMALAPNGDVFFAGPFFGSISFGGPIIEPNRHNEFDDTYLAALTPAGDYVFSRNLAQRDVYSIASSEGITAVSTPARAMVFDSEGQEIRGENGRNPVPGSGTPAPIAVGSGRVYWNFEVSPVSGSPPYPYLIAYRPDV